jgi:predicted DNA-binding ArsR family transcriptional regulator
MNSNEEIKKILKMLEARIEKQLVCPELRRDWIPKEELMEFFGYGNTQMLTIEKKYGLVTTEIGKRKFYSVKSAAKTMENNIIK